MSILSFMAVIGLAFAIGKGIQFLANQSPVIKSRNSVYKVNVVNSYGEVTKSYNHVRNFSDSHQGGLISFDITEKGETREIRLKGTKQKFSDIN